MPRTSVNLLHVQSESIGYGRLGMQLAKELAGLGLEVYDDLPGVGDLGKHLSEGRNSGIAPVAAWISVPTHASGWYRDQTPVIFTMWESSTLPISFRETLHEFDTVMVPSPQNLELFSRYHDNVKLNVLGVDPAVWHYTSRKPPGRWFNYLIGGSGTRKGTDLAYAAFKKLWGRPGSWPADGPIPRLIFKNPRGEDFYGERIEMVSGRISAEAEVALYEDAHCYLQPSRGEGFGLQPLQAIAQGCPTILTAAHGHESFAHLGMGISAKPAKAAYFIYGDAGDWWEPSLDDLCDRMRQVYEDWSREEAIAKVNARELVLEGFTWKACAERFVSLIGPEKFADRPVGSEWYAPIHQQFVVMTTRDWACSIAGRDFQFRQGVEAWVPADVKRILFEADLLDPACLKDDEHGLVPEEVARLADYRRDHEFCVTCHQRLGSGVTRADEVERSIG